MRLIGNKTKLLGEIEGLLLDQGIEGGTLIDIFSGSCSVAKHFKRRGYRVVANDLLPVCYAQAVASVEVSRPPAYRKFSSRYRAVLDSADFHELLYSQADMLESIAAAEAPGKPPKMLPLVRAVGYLNHCVEPVEGLVYRNYCPGGEAGRGYFTDSNGRRIDGILGFLRDAYREGLFTRGEFYLLLSALLDAADRVANISGTYGAYLKSWQASAKKPLRLALPEVIGSSQRNKAFNEDANTLVRRLKGDVLYIDPPYNQRQYAANYHVPDILAGYHLCEDLGELEASLYGKTGLRPYGHLKSAYCVRSRRSRKSPAVGTAGATDVFSALLDLVMSTKARSIVVSYNEEGLLTRDEIGVILARFSGTRSYDFDANFREINYKRFRSDRDREENGAAAGRSYKVVEGREKDEIGEWLFFAGKETARVSS